MYTIKANTPEAAKAQIVEWLNYNASVHSSKARLASRKKVMAEEQIKASAYSDAAKFLETITIQS